MFRALQNCNLIKSGGQYIIRNLSSTELSTALRPFYFSVHPDLFCQHPKQRETNENSLQQLSSILETLQANTYIKPISLPFYVKDQISKKGGSKISFKLVMIQIEDKDIREVVMKILKSCNLSTDYVETIPKVEPKQSKKSDFIQVRTTASELKKKNPYHPLYEQMIYRQNLEEAKVAKKLVYWLKNNYEKGLSNLKNHLPFKAEIERLSTILKANYGIKDIKWECGWSDSHLKGCLLSFKALADQHPGVMYMLRGRTLIFSYISGVNLEGHVMLYTGEVRSNWLDIIKKIRKFDAALMRIPAFEKSLSHVLRDIKVGRRTGMPKIGVSEYEKDLQRITTTLSDYIGYKSFPKEWPSSLSSFEIVVETEAAPLMVSPAGQFIVPSMLPAAHLVNFITNHMLEAQEKIITYKINKSVEADLQRKTIKELNLYGLRKDDNITSEKMISCCNRLLKNKKEVSVFTKGIILNISTYYSVLSDGVMCIPWNWEL